MGCSCAKSSRVQDVRQRLSVSIVDEPDSKDAAASPEKDPGVVMNLSQEQLMNIIDKYQQVDSTIMRRRCSLGSMTDTLGNVVAPFSQKETKAEGENVMLLEHAIGWACKKGLKPEAPNQDSFFITKVEDLFSLFGVFDGHGKKGHDVSNFVKEHLPKILLAKPDILVDPVGALESAFEQTQQMIVKATESKEIDASKSGTTASVVLHDVKKGMLYIAHVGDSRCVLGTRHDAGWYTTDLTEDHKPNMPAERERIEKAGGMVVFDGGYNYRVYAKGKRYPGLNMSRAMGDLVGYYDAGISAMPDVATQCLQRIPNAAAVKNPPKCPLVQNTEFVPEVDVGTSHLLKSGAGRDSVRSNSSNSLPSYTVSANPSVSSCSLDPTRENVLLVCSDGIWEFMNSEEAVRIVGEFPRHDCMKAAEEVSRLAWDRWIRNMQGEVVDDITALVIHLPFNE